MPGFCKELNSSSRERTSIKLHSSGQYGYTSESKRINLWCCLLNFKKVGVSSDQTNIAVNVQQEFSRYCGGLVGVAVYLGRLGQKFCGWCGVGSRGGLAFRSWIFTIGNKSANVMSSLCCLLPLTRTKSRIWWSIC